MHKHVGKHYQSHSKGMTEKEIIEYLEIVFKDITDFELVSVNNPITKVLKHQTKEERENFFSVVDNVELFAKNNDLIKKIGTGDFFKLTKNGKKLKKLGSYSEYLKHIKKKDLKPESKVINVNGVYIEKNENNKNQSFENIANKKQVNAEPNIIPVQKSRLKKILSDPWFIGISLLILTVVFNAERIKNWVDSIIDGI
jgi:hypothetical protein